MIDKQQVIDTFVNIARERIGSLLSVVDQGGTPVPAVIPKPLSKEATLPSTTPYMIISVVMTRDRTPNGVGELIDVNDNTVYQGLTDFLVSFNCYGGDANDIIHKLHNSLKMDSLRDRVRDETDGVIRRVNNPVSLPKPLATIYQEASSFDLIWSGVDEVVDTSSTVIDTININLTQQIGI